MKHSISLGRVITGALVYASSFMIGLSGASAHAAQDTLTQFQYDPNGNLTQVTDPLGKDTNFAYDALNRLQQQLFPAAQLG